MATLPPLDVSAEDRAVLEGRVRAHTSEQHMVVRARVVLMAADGHPNPRIAAATGLSGQGGGPLAAPLCQRRAGGAV